MAALIGIAEVALIGGIMEVAPIGTVEVALIGGMIRWP